MIFVTVGSSTIPFDRLLHAIDGLRPDEPLVVQHGASAVRPRYADCVEFLGYEEFVELIRAARVTITHAGAGSVITALGERRRPIVVPREHEYGEAVDDHQIPFSRRLAELGLITLVDDLDLLGLAIAAHASDALAVPSRRSPVETALRTYIEDCIGPGSPLVVNEGRTTWS